MSWYTAEEIIELLYGENHLVWKEPPPTTELTPEYKPEHCHCYDCDDE